MTPHRAAVEATAVHPFPGLRTFREKEAHLFFGRDGQSNEIIQALGRSRFVAVVGSSGCGKSSLIRAGLLPSLYAGYFAGVGSKWRIADLHPAGDPIGHLWRALEFTGVPNDSGRETLYVRSSAVADLIGSARGRGDIDRDENVLLLVDQFEELFRYPAKQESATADRDEKAHFVQLLLEAASRTDQRIYVLLAMRVDFLGECAQFRDLPESINSGQYLVPRLTRQQRRTAIEGPIRVAGAVIAPRLTQRLLNELGEDPDQLPVLQHALMRTWDEWVDRGQPDSEIDFEHYESIGGLELALSKHADDTLAEAVGSIPGGETAVKLIFQRLRDRDDKGRETRRPASVRDLCAITGLPFAQIRSILDCFRDDRLGRTFLSPLKSDLPELSENTEIDVTHESLLRRWKKLAENWVPEEDDSRRLYTRLAERAEEEGPRTQNLLKGAVLRRTLEWWQERQPSQAWAKRYHPGFESAKQFLFRSRDGKRRQKYAWILSVGVTVMCLAGYAVWQYKRTLDANTLLEASIQLLSVALAHDLVANAIKDLETDPQRSIVEAMQAVLVIKPPIPEAEDALHRALQASRIRLTVNSHSRELRAIFSPDGNLLASGDEEGVIRLWNASSGEEMPRWNGHNQPVRAITFSHDGRFLASASEDKTVKVWNVPGWSWRATLRHADKVNDVAFSRDGTRLATAAGDGYARVWEVPSDVGVFSGAELFSLPHGGVVFAVAFSPNGKRLATAGENNMAKVWDMDSRQLTLSFKHEKPVYRVNFSPDGNRLATACLDGTAKVWDLEPDKEPVPSENRPLILEHGETGEPEPVWGVAFSPDGRYVATAGGVTAKLWHLSRGRPSIPYTLRGHTGPLRGLAFSPDGRRLATTSRDDGKSADAEMKVWEVAPLAELLAFCCHNPAVRGVAFSGNYVATASDDGTAVKVWDASSGKEFLSRSPEARRPGSLFDVAFSPNRRELASGWGDGNVRTWNLFSSGRHSSLDTGQRGVRRVVFSPNGRFMATLSGERRERNRTAKVWDVSSLSHTKPLTLPGSGSFRTLAFSSNSNFLATAGGEGIVVWDTSSGNKVKEMTKDDAFLAIAFSTADKLAAGKSDGTTMLWHDIKDLEPVTLQGHQKEVNDVAFSRDGKHLATASSDGTAKVWDASSGKELLTLRHPVGARVLGVAFNSDGKYLATTCSDKFLRIYVLEIEDLMALAQRRGRKLREEECKDYLHQEKCPKELRFK